MQFTDRGILAVVALSDWQEVMAARIHLLVLWMRRKKLKLFCSTYLHWHSQPPPFLVQNNRFRKTPDNFKVERYGTHKHT